MDGQGKIHKSGWKVEEKKVQCEGTAEGGMRGVGEGKGRSGRDLRSTHNYLTLYNIPRSDQNC